MSRSPKSRLIITYEQNSANRHHTEEGSEAAVSNLSGKDITFRVEGIDQFINTPNNPTGPMVLVDVTAKEYKDIMAGKPLSLRLQKALEAN